MLNRRLYQTGSCKKEGDEEGEETQFQNNIKNKRKISPSNIDGRLSLSFWLWWSTMAIPGKSHHSPYSRHQINPHSKKAMMNWIFAVVILLLFCFTSSSRIIFFNGGNNTAYLSGGNYDATQRRSLLAKQENEILVDWKLIHLEQRSFSKKSSSSWMQSPSSSGIFYNDNDVQQQQQQDDHKEYRDDQTILLDICSNRKVVNLTSHNDVNIQPQSWTIVMTINDGYFDFFLNWYRHYEKLQLSLDLVLFAEDSKAYLKLINAKEGGLFSGSKLSSSSSSHVTIVYTGLEKVILGRNKPDNLSNNIRRRGEGEVVGTEAFDANSPQYNRLISMRPSRLLSVLCTGRDVLYVDADTVWRSNPLIHLQDEAYKANEAATDDVTETTDGYLAVDVRKIPKRIASHGVEFCTGFAALKATRKTLELVSQWELSCQSTEGGQNDQQIFNKVYHRLLKKGETNNGGGIARIQGLPKSFFPNGDEYFIQFSDNDRKQVVQVHANFMVGKETKKKKLQEYGVWIVIHSAATGKASDGSLVATPGNIQKKYMWYPPIPDGNDLAVQLEEAEVFLDGGAVDFLMKICCGHRGIFMAAMRWVEERQKAEGRHMVNSQNKWLINKCVTEVRHSFEESDRLKRRDEGSGWDIGLKEHMTKCRAIMVNGIYRELDNIPDEFIEVIFGGSRQNQKLNGKERDLTIAGFLVPERDNADEEFVEYNWNKQTTRYGVANSLMAQYYSDSFSGLGYQRDMIEFKPKSGSDLLARALPFMTFTTVVDNVVIHRGRLKTPLSPRLLPYEDHYNGAFAKVFEDLGYSVSQPLNAEGKVDLIVCFEDGNSDKKTCAIETIMAHRTLADHNEHGRRLQSPTGRITPALISKQL